MDEQTRRYVRNRLAQRARDIRNARPAWRVSMLHSREVRRENNRAARKAVAHYGQLYLAHYGTEIAR